MLMRVGSSARRIKKNAPLTEVYLVYPENVFWESFLFLAFMTFISLLLVL
jgi:hypothetical protein